jgi:hypothetical protein
MSARARWRAWWAGVLVLRGEHPITITFDEGLLVINLGERGLA